MEEVESRRSNGRLNSEFRSQKTEKSEDEDDECLGSKVDSQHQCCPKGSIDGSDGSKNRVCLDSFPGPSSFDHRLPASHCLSRTLLAESVENDLVIGHLESRRGKFLEPLDAFLEIKDGLAFAAMKMVVVSFFGALVAWRLARNLNTADLPVLDEGLDGTVSGGDANSRNHLQRIAMDFLGKQGMIVLLEDGLDGLFLSGSASLG